MKKAIVLFLNWIRRISVVEHLQGQSANIVDVFSKTTQQLSDVNAEIAKHVQKREDKIVQARNEQDTLNAQHSTNTKLIQKLNNFLEN